MKVPGTVSRGQDVNEPLNVLSLCSGIGGLDLGLENTGRIRVCGQVEIDPWCRSILAEHWPGVPQHDDIRTCADWWTGEPRPRIDLVAGGIPCQPHSQAGRKLGTADPRWLWPAFSAVVESAAPPLILIENVPRLVRTGLVAILRDLADLGFDAWWDRVPAAAFGAPHLRWRLILIAAHPGRVTFAREPFTGEYRERPGYDGTTWYVADPAGDRLERDQPAGAPAGRQAEAAGRRRPACQGAAGRAETMADTVSAGLEDRRFEPGVDGEKFPSAVGDGDQRPAGACQSGLGRGFGGPASWLDGTWEHGIPRTCPPGVNPAERSARLRAIGNAVVPAVAEYAGRVLFGCDPRILALESRGR